jgi:hypothetical protein
MVRLSYVVQFLTIANPDREMPAMRPTTDINFPPFPLLTRSGGKNAIVESDPHLITVDGCEPGSRQSDTPDELSQTTWAQPWTCSRMGNHDTHNQPNKQTNNCL